MPGIEKEPPLNIEQREQFKTTLEWGMVGKEEGEKLVHKLSAAVNKPEPEVNTIVEIFRDIRNVRRFVTLRGRHLNTLKNIKKGYRAIISDDPRFSNTPLKEIPPQELVDMTQDKLGNHQIIAEMTDVIFHETDPQKQTPDLIDEKEAELNFWYEIAKHTKDPLLVLRIKHNRASFAGSKQKNSTEQTRLNKEIISALEKLTEKGIYDQDLFDKAHIGIAFGLTDPRQKAAKFQEIIDRMSQRENCAKDVLGISFVYCAHANAIMAQTFEKKRKKTQIPEDKVRFKKIVGRYVGTAEQMCLDAEDCIQGYSNLETLVLKVKEITCKMNADKECIRKVKKRIQRRQKNYLYTPAL
jgi:hypothetical protein